MILDFQDVVLAVLWLSIGTLMLSLVLAMSLNKTIKRKVGWVMAVIFAFILFVAWADHRFFKQPWHTERPEAQTDSTDRASALAFDSTLGGGANA